MRRGIFNISHLSAGFSAVLVGYTSSVVLIIQAATAAGATEQQTGSWLLALGVVMGLSSMAFSWFYKVPLLTAWSTPGAAMLITVVNDYPLSNVIGAFIISAALITLTGLLRPISCLLERIPAQLATAMLAAILLPFCLKAFTPVMSSPVIFCSMFAAFMVAKRFLPRYAMLILLISGIICSFFAGAFAPQLTTFSVARPVWMTPTFDLMAILNISLPLYIITMLSQNLPGFAMLQSHHYSVPAKPVFIATGLSNLLFAPFGAFSVNLAAISAAICMGDEVDPDKTQRYRAAIWAGIFYLIAGIWATTVVTLFLALPAEVTQLLAGLALLGTLLMCLQTAFAREEYREAALMTFLLSLSGITLFGIGATIWGLLVGLIEIKLTKKRQKTDPLSTSDHSKKEPKKAFLPGRS
ncbi:benzoate/H(+) symporter BenE family transporter [Psychromonas sp.]|uniref:benzoate/H(+) symporter BenE family transporter n=1 Tax=Psychromonas sp. TaxID=1884585 RepID=UPI0035699E55